MTEREHSNAAYRYESLKDEGPKRKYARAVVIAPDGAIVRTYRGPFAMADANNEATRLNRRAVS